MKLLYKYPFTTRLHDIDAAGVVFFGRYFYYAHDAYESFLSQQKLSLAEILASEFLLPISQTNAKFKGSICINERITIEILLVNVLETEFHLNYLFKDASGIIKAELNSAHVCIDAPTKKRIPLDKRILKALG